ncbi:GNAT family N-acetyltransferase [Paenibacillus sp. sptzw28]|nr:GNAT family N-acetyltransferase [Paenibacillus sp. sptzw28]
MNQNDCEYILKAADDWWGGHYSSDMLSRWYIHHFRETCLLAEENGKIVGFIIGFLSQSEPDEAYIRIVMVDPAWRGKGIGRSLYETFFERAGSLGRSVIRCVTAPGKKNSIAFHARLGFMIEPQEQELGGVPAFINYDGRGGNRVVFKKVLDNMSEL